MEHYVYYPFGEARMDSHTRLSYDYYKSRYGNRVLLGTAQWVNGELQSGGKPLEVLRATAAEKRTLVVDCHGTGKEFRRNEVDCVHLVDFLYPDELAKQLKAEGLPDDQQWIKLSVCLSDAASESMALALARALKGPAPHALVCGASKELVVNKLSTDKMQYGCLKCGSLLTEKVGFMFMYNAGDEPSTAVAPSHGRRYYNTDGLSKTKEELRGRSTKPATEHKFICPSCGPITPADIGNCPIPSNEMLASRRVLIPIVGPKNRFKKFDVAKDGRTTPAPR